MTPSEKAAGFIREALALTDPSLIDLDKITNACAAAGRQDLAEELRCFGDDIEDLEGQLALISALREFDPSAPANLEAY